MRVLVRAGERKRASALLLPVPSDVLGRVEELVHGVRAGALDVDLGEHGKVHLVAGARKLKNLLIAARLLRAELIAGEAKHSKSLVSIFFL